MREARSRHETCGRLRNNVRLQFANFGWLNRRIEQRLTRLHPARARSGGSAQWQT